MNPQSGPGNEEDWTHKIFWILTKVSNFRSLAKQKLQVASSQAEHLQSQQRRQQWLDLKQYCDRWHRCIPPTMHAMVYIPPHLTSSDSYFPEVWFIKRATAVARLFYHTAMAILCTLHPMIEFQPTDTAEMQGSTIRHSRQICGIVRHVKERGIATVAVPCLAIAAENLVARREQEEVLRIFDKIKQETGWLLAPASLQADLQKKWGWDEPHR
jgi:hypothetical protein